ncbi:hypothetical protein RM531_15590 [Salinisphaera sp. P385]|uniref:Uncharacterized protein n=1 Tax=Spectribacter acetivorans TaxID=3075603 RepID=A0ABU3BCZ7_9GAMM|nr:hypothetical protein [Salinisphaera sp. P385]MDT0619895.1 hypothetical protein [Salinisphaera sp. P385]
MTQIEIAERAKAHWRIYLPNRYARLVSEGKLDREAMAAANLTLMEMETLKLGGANEWEAWEAARDIFVLVDPARDETPDYDE